MEKIKKGDFIRICTDKVVGEEKTNLKGFIFMVTEVERNYDIVFEDGTETPEFFKNQTMDSFLGKQMFGEFRKYPILFWAIPEANLSKLTPHVVPLNGMCGNQEPQFYQVMPKTDTTASYDNHPVNVLKNRRIAKAHFKENPAVISFRWTSVKSLDEERNERHTVLESEVERVEIGGLLDPVYMKAMKEQNEILLKNKEAFDLRFKKPIIGKIRYQLEVQRQKNKESKKFFKEMKQAMSINEDTMTKVMKKLGDVDEFLFAGIRGDEIFENFAREVVEQWRETYGEKLISRRGYRTLKNKMVKKFKAPKRRILPFEIIRTEPVFRLGSKTSSSWYKKDENKNWTPIPKRISEIVSRCILKYRKQFIVEENIIDFETINSGYSGFCPEFAEGVFFEHIKNVCSADQLEKVSIVSTDDISFNEDFEDGIDLSKIEEKMWSPHIPSDYAVGEDLKKTEGIREKVRETFLKECPYHVWICGDGIHYDAECPEGVIHPFALPIFKRKLKKIFDEEVKRQKSEER